MRGWILILAVLATFQAIVQVASTDSAMGLTASSGAPKQSNSSSSSRTKRHRTLSSPTLSFAAIVAAPAQSEFSLTNLNNIVLNSDNVKYPSSEREQETTSAQEPELLVPVTNSLSSSSSANAVVNTKSSSNSSSSGLQRESNSVDKVNNFTNGSSKLMGSEQIASVERRHRKRTGKAHPRRRNKKGRSSENSIQRDLQKRQRKQQQQQQEQQSRLSSNELNVEDTEEDVQEEDVEEEEEEQSQQQQERVKPDAETLVTIEKNLLTLFGFKKRPKIDRSKVVIPEAMRRMYAEATGMELDLPDIPKPAVHRAHYSANTVRSFTHEESKIDHRFVHHHRFRLHFNTSNIPADEILKAAELVLSRDAVPDADRVRHRVQVYDIVRPGIKGKREPSFLLIDTKIVKVNTTENLILDVTPAMERWQREPKHNHGLLVHVSTAGRRGAKRVVRSAEDGPEISLDGPMHHHVRLRRSVRDSDEDWSKKQPLLFAYTDDKRHRASRAAKEGSASHGGKGGNGRVRNRSKKKPRGICQRHALWVDFEDVGWNDWIVAPRGYDAFYCKGECRIPMADHLNATNHAVVQSLVNSINGKLAPRACCVPTQLTTISLLYLDDQNKLVLKKYQDMAVVGCGCR